MFQEELDQEFQGLAKGPRKPSPRDPRPWPSSQGNRHQGIQALGKGAKNTFTKESKALAKEPRRPLPS